MASSKVALKEAMREVGMSEMKPTVSTRSEGTPEGRDREWTVTSKVAKSLSSGWSRSDLVSACKSKV